MSTKTRYQYEDILSNLSEERPKTITAIARDMYVKRDDIEDALMTLEVSGYIKRVLVGGRRAWIKSNIDGIHVLEFASDGVTAKKIKVHDMIFNTHNDYPFVLDPLKVISDFFRVFDVQNTVFTNNTQSPCSQDAVEKPTFITEYNVNELVHIPYSSVGSIVVNDKIINDGSSNVSVGKVNSNNIYLHALVALYDAFHDRAFVTYDARGITNYFSKSDLKTASYRIRMCLRFLQHIGCVKAYESPNKDYAEHRQERVYQFIASPFDKLNIIESEGLIVEQEHLKLGSTNMCTVLHKLTVHELREKGKKDVEQNPRENYVKLIRDTEKRINEIYESIKKDSRLEMPQYETDILDYVLKNRVNGDDSISLDSLRTHLGLNNALRDIISEYQVTIVSDDDLALLDMLKRKLGVVVNQRLFNVIKSNIPTVCKDATFVRFSILDDDDKPVVSNELTFNNYKQRILDLLRQCNTPLSVTSLVHALGIQYKKYDILRDWCKKLVEMGCLRMYSNNRYVLAEQIVTEKPTDTTPTSIESIEEPATIEDVKESNPVELNAVTTDEQLSNDEIIKVLKSTKKITYFTDDMCKVLAEELYATYKDKIFDMNYIKAYFKRAGYYSHIGLVNELVRYMMFEKGLISFSGNDIYNPHYKFVKEP